MRLRHILSAAPLLLGACATSRMAVPAELASAPDLAVSGLQGWNAGRKLTFGEFHVDGVSRGSPQVRRAEGDPLDGLVDASGRVQGPGRVAGAEARTVGMGRERSRERFRFRLRAGEGPAWRTECGQAAEQHRSDLPVVGEVTHGFRAALTCVVRPADDASTSAASSSEASVEAGAAPWTLQVNDERRLAGTLIAGDARFTLAQLDHMEGSSYRQMDPTGVVFRRDGRPVAAVDLLNGGRVRMDPSLTPEQRAAIASAAAALLLRADLERELDQT